MKQPTSHVDHEKRRQRKVLIFSIIMIGLMVFSVAEIIIYSNSGSSGDRTAYGEYEFQQKATQMGTFWTLQINGQEVEFRLLPTQAESLDVDPRAPRLLRQAQQVVLTSDPNISIADAQLVDYVRLQLSLAMPKTVNAMTSESDLYSLPVVDCSRASAQMPVILFNISNESRTRVDGDCIIVDAQGADLVDMKDRLIFEYIGIMENGTIVGR